MPHSEDHQRAKQPHPSAHDALFRAAFSNPERAAELLRSALPTDVCECIEWRDLRRIDTSFIDDELRSGHADLLFATTIASDERELLIYLLLEHKSHCDPLTPFQMLRYVVRIWEQVLREQPGRSKLPAVLPYVLFHGAKEWTGARSLREAIDTEGLPPGLIALQPQISFVLDDLTRQAAQLVHRPLSVHALLPLLHLQHVRGAGPTTDLLRQWRKLYQQLQGDPSGQEILALLVSYVWIVSNDDPRDLRDAYARVGKPTEETFMTAADKLIQQGIAQGITTGKREGQTQMLGTLIEQRFGPLSPDIRETLQNANEQDLERWARRVLTAESIAGLFAN